MVNLIAERDVVRELVQADFTPQRVCEELRRIICQGEDRVKMLEEFAEVRRRLEVPGRDGTASDRAARAVLDLAREAQAARKPATSF